MLSQPQPSRPTGNVILGALNAAEYQHFLSQLEQVTFAQGDVVYEPGDKIDYVYFPETAVFSMLCMMEDGDTAEVGPVGREGVVGLNIFFGVDTTPTQLIAHVAGTAQRVSADLFKQELRSERSVMPHLLFRYTQMLLAMTGQSSACNKLHSLEQHLSKWLLMMHDYVSDELLLTHELIALTLGVRRAGISESSNAFKSEGLIAYNRGHIQILNRQGLERKSCECYKVIRDEYERLYHDLSRITK
ncbi:MAG TPA: Crp/Fnr family transcriptional regulator [Pyrinomonadaceae bacterium]|jgi:CRP-like cAMP-binding protein|nr:Crp/Fnr family transcriptional regulator [Pyrinomonadaceae bacterium]